MICLRLSENYRRGRLATLGGGEWIVVRKDAVITLIPREGNVCQCILPQQFNGWITLSTG